MRIDVARAAIRQAPLLILDEPTTGLDGENERAVIEALERLTEGRTTFLITHDLQLAARGPHRSAAGTGWRTAPPPAPGRYARRTGASGGAVRETGPPAARCGPRELPRCHRLG